MESENGNERPTLESLVPGFSETMSQNVGVFLRKAKQHPKLVECLLLLVLNKVGLT